MAGVKKTQASVTITFGEGDNPSAPVVFEGHQGYCNVFKFVCYRIYPAAVEDVRASAGEISPKLDSKKVVTKKEYITFNNSDRGSVQYPVTEVVSISVDVFFTADGTPEVDSYNPSYPDARVTAGGNLAPGESGLIGITYNPDTAEFVASAPFFGIAYVEYITDYRIWHYVPQTTETGTFSFVRNTLAYSTVWGMLAAIYKGGITTFATNPRDAGSAGNETYEVYRVISESIVNQEGAWEKHPDFPTRTWSDVKAPTANSPYMTYERVHEVGLLLAGKNHLEVVSYNVRNEPPKIGSSTWKPVYTVKWDDGKGTIGTVFEHAWSLLDFADIVTDLKLRFTNLKGTEDAPKS